MSTQENPVAGGTLSCAVIVAATVGSLAPGLSVARAGEAHLELETSIVLSARNQTRIPGDAGTTLSLTDDLSTAATPAFRVRAGLRFAERHWLSALYAPLRLTASGNVDRDVRFGDGLYPAGTPLLAVYRFDSYRLTYRYSFVHRHNLELAAGLTAKLRAAETSLYGVDAQRETNLGFVPLVNLHAQWRPRAGRLGVLVDADALAAPQGRAEDVLLAVTWAVRDEIGLRLGYRMLEGGVDNNEVYSFAWLHYLVAGAALQF
jgi:hypothetical protein